jgi:uncharacterized membrane protein HdeD (DUF308 family)
MSNANEAQRNLWRARMWASIVGISLGTGLLIGVAISQHSPLVFVGWALLVAGYSLNILVQREFVRRSP